MSNAGEGWGLAIETSSSQGGAACLMRQGEPRDRLVLGSEQRSAQALIPALRQLLDSQSLQPRDVHWLGLTIGPGSFTGLRVGITLAKLFGMSTGAELVACTTTEVLAWQAHHSTKPVATASSDILVVLDAQRRQFFAQSFVVRDDEVVKRNGPQITTADNLLGWMEHGTLLTGPGLGKLFKKQPELEPRAVDPKWWEPQPEWVGRRCFQRWMRNETIDPLRLEPIYIRDSAAEEVYRARQGQ